MRQRTANDGTAVGFTGELQDGGLVHLRARWYDPSSGVFTAVDPFAGFPETPYSLNQYQYGHGNPIRNGDPSGYVCTGVGSIDAATGCNDAVSDAVNDIIVCGPKPESNDLISPRYWCNPTTHQWEVISMGMVIVAPAPGVVQGAGRVGDLLRACATALAAAAGASMSDVNVDTQTEEQRDTFITFYRGVTYYDGLRAQDEGFDADGVLSRRQSGREMAPGLYTSRNRNVALYFAQINSDPFLGSPGQEGGPALMSITLSQRKFVEMSAKYSIVDNHPVAGLPPTVPGPHVETLFPYTSLGELHANAVITVEILPVE